MGDVASHLVGGAKGGRVVSGSEALLQARQTGQEQAVEGVDAQGARAQRVDHGLGGAGPLVARKSLTIIDPSTVNLKVGSRSSTCTARSRLRL